MKRGNYQKGEIEISEVIEVYRNAWGTLYDDSVKFPGGATGRYLRFLWKAPYTIAVLPQTIGSSILLLRIFRHGSRDWSIEFPKGFGVANTSPLAAAKRELLEETGYSSSRWSNWGSLLIDPGLGPTKCHLFYAAECIRVSDPKPEMTEAIDRVEHVKFDEIQHQVSSGKINDAISCYLALRFERSKSAK